MRRFALSCAVLLAATLNSGCTAAAWVAAAPSVIQAFTLSDADEIKIGQQTRDKMLVEYPAYPNPVLRDYLQEIGQKLVAQTDRTKLKWEWYVVDSTEINAFAAPGGFVFVTTGALKLMTNTAQLAGVVGHEVAHVAKQHSLNAIKQSLITQGVLTGALGGSDNAITQAGANLAANLILKHGDRGQESEADQMGATYAYNMGYDPRELGTFLTTLSQQAGETPAWATWFSDHPGTNDRVNALTAYFAKQGYTFDSKTKGEAEYQTKVLTTLGVTTTTP